MEKIFFYFLPLSIKACVVIPLIIAVRFCIKKQPKVYSYALWLVVFIGLVFDLQISIPQSKQLYNPISHISTVVNNHYNEIMDDYVGDVQFYHDNRLEYYTAVDKGIIPVYNSENNTRYVVLSANGQKPDTVSSSFMPKLAFVWFIGVFVGIYHILKSYIIFKHKVQIVEKKEDIYYTKGINTPFVYGLFNPKVCIPAEMIADSMQSVIEHEKFHIHRKDHIVKPMCMFITVLHWFNPLVWFAFKLLCKDMEMSCDEAVVNKNGNKKEYSLQLLNCATEKSSANTVAVLFGESDAESRIKNILSYKKPAKIVSMLMVIVIAIVSTACMVKEKAEEIMPLPIPPTFYEQLAQLNSTADVQYKERELIEGYQLVKNTDILPADQMYVTTVIPSEIAEGSTRLYGLGYNNITGTVTQTKDGPFSSFVYLLNDSNKLHLCYADEREYVLHAVDMPQGHKLMCVATGIEKLADNLEIFSYYTEDTEGEMWLNIHRIKDNDTEIFQHKMNKDNLFILRGLRFINENVGFMGQTKSEKYNIPQANITLDGGKTWQQLDFSQLTAPKYFTDYRACCMVVLDNFIEIRYFVGINDELKEKTQGNYPFSTTAESYSIISEDGGLTWTGYLRVRNTHKGIGYTHQKVTDTIPVQVLAQ